MARIKTYEVDNIVSDNDIVIGSDADSNDNTKNFKVSDLRDYILGGIEPVIGGNLKITTIVSNNVLYTTPESYFNSSVTPIVVLQYEIIFLILNGKTFIFRKNNATYGVGQTQAVNSDFTEIDVTANIEENLQDLDSVLSEGNLAPTRSANVAELGLLDDFSSPAGYAKIYVDNLKFWLQNKLGATISVISNNNVQFNVGAYSFNMRIPEITANRIAEFQDASGTIAYTSDIPETYVVDVTSNSDEITVVNTDGEIELTYNEQKDVVLMKTYLIDTLTNITYYGDGGSFSFDEVTEPINALKLSFEENIVSNFPQNFGYYAFHYKDGSNAIYTIPRTGHSVSGTNLTVKLPLIDYWSIDLSYFSIHLLVGCVSSATSGRGFKGLTPSGITNYYNTAV